MSMCCAQHLTLSAWVLRVKSALSGTSVKRCRVEAAVGDGGPRVAKVAL